jgi:hypothetical protein
VSCGGHSRPTCAQCPMGHGAGWCHGDCEWVSNQCQLKAPGAKWAKVTDIRLDDHVISPATAAFTLFGLCALVGSAAVWASHRRRRQLQDGRVKPLPDEPRLLEVVPTEDYGVE